MPSDAYDTPITATPIRQAVVVQMPAGAGDATFTVAAALQSAQHLIEAVRLAMSNGEPTLDD
jgi:hypothetical protein